MTVSVVAAHLYVVRIIQQQTDRQTHFKNGPMGELENLTHYYINCPVRKNAFALNPRAFTVAVQDRYYCTVHRYVVALIGM